MRSSWYEYSSRPCRWGVSLAVVFAASYAIGSTRASQRGSGGTAVSVAVLLLGLFLLVLAIRVAAEFVAPMVLSLVLTLAVVPLGAAGTATRMAGTPRDATALA